MIRVLKGRLTTIIKWLDWQLSPDVMANTDARQLEAFRKQFMPNSVVKPSKAVEREDLRLWAEVKRRRWIFVGVLISLACSCAQTITAIVAVCKIK